MGNDYGSEIARPVKVTLMDYGSEYESAHNMAISKTLSLQLRFHNLNFGNQDSNIKYESYEFKLWKCQLFSQMKSKNII